MVAGESDSFIAEDGGAVEKDVSVRCHVLVVRDSCLPTKFGFIFSTQYLLDREKGCGGFGVVQCSRI